MSEPARALEQIASAQGRAFTRRQAIAAGFSADSVKFRVRRGTWQRLYPGVYAQGRQTPERATLLWAAVLYGGPGAVLSHQTAAELNELTDQQDAFVHVSIPEDRKVVAVCKLRIHRVSRELDTLDGFRDPPHTTVERTLLDLVQAATTLDEAVAWITAAFGRELTTEQRLLHELSHRDRIRWRPELTDIISCGAAGDHSVLEYRFTRDVERAHRFPAATRQVPFLKPDGKKGFRDRVYADYGIAVELDGRLAHKPEDSWRDKNRDRAAILSGLEPLRYGWAHVHDHACDSAAELYQLLRARGWQGRPRPCSTTCAMTALVP